MTCTATSKKCLEVKMIVYHESGGCAFPSDRSFGMTLRDYFAAQALASSTVWYLSEINNWDNKERADWAYKQADQMLKARESDE